MDDLGMPRVSKVNFSPSEEIVSIKLKLSRLLLFCSIAFNAITLKL